MSSNAVPINLEYRRKNSRLVYDSKSTTRSNTSVKRNVMNEILVTWSTSHYNNACYSYTHQVSSMD
jgi:hypothetical protein